MPPIWARQGHALLDRGQVGAAATLSSHPLRCFLTAFIVGVVLVSIDMLQIPQRINVQDKLTQPIELLQQESTLVPTLEPGGVTPSAVVGPTLEPSNRTSALTLEPSPSATLEHLTVSPAPTSPSSMSNSSVEASTEAPSELNSSFETSTAIPAPTLEPVPTIPSPTLPVPPHEAQFAQDLWLVSQQGPQQPRGLVIPLFEGITILGKTLILELRSLGVDLPIEIPHCGDLPERHQAFLAQNDSLVHIYNVCEEAERAETSLGKLFCRDPEHCHRFRSFYIKILAVVFSRFQEIMLLDADTIHFQSPMNLWETEKYKTTGTLFFHDRVSWETDYMGQLMPDQPLVTYYQNFMANYNVAPFRSLKNIPRRKGVYLSTSTIPPVTLPFEPSEFLVNSHTWNRRAGMEMESSVMLWNKARHPRATAVLASMISINQTERPPSYGDKEYFFIACELAETAYSFSDFGVGVAGWDLKTFHEEVSGYPQFTICGEILQFYPERKKSDGNDPTALEAVPQFMNGDPMFTWKPAQTSLYRAKARVAEFFFGFGVPHYCPYNVSIVPFLPQEDNRLHERQVSVEVQTKELESFQTGNGA